MIIIDAHVHIYDCFDLETLFNAAHQNFLKQAEKLKAKSRFCGLLLLTEKNEDNKFDHLLQTLNKKGEYRIGRWQILKTDETFTLKILSDNNELLYLIKGQQFVSEEGLEVLSLISDDVVHDKLPLAELVKKIKRNNGVAVLPWAFGKWLGKRGGIVKDFLQVEENLTTFLGDNGGRPFLYRSSFLKRYTRTKESVLISGSDPLPLRNEENRVGGFGVYVDVPADAEKIGEQLRNIFQHHQQSVVSFGKQMGLIKFIQNQIQIRRI